MFPPPIPASLHKSLLTLDEMFFKQSILEDAFKSCWYLVKINVDER